MADIPTADWSWIDSAAERFERAWKNGERPRIEDFLIKVAEPHWSPLLEELMLLKGSCVVAQATIPVLKNIANDSRNM